MQYLSQKHYEIRRIPQKFCSNSVQISQQLFFFQFSYPNVNKLSHQAVNWLHLLLALAGTACQLSLPVSR